MSPYRALPFLLAAAVVVWFGVPLFWPRILQNLYLRAAARSVIPMPRGLVRFYRSRGFIVLWRIIGALGVFGGCYVLWHLILGR